MPQKLHKGLNLLATSGFTHRLQAAMPTLEDLFLKLRGEGEDRHVKRVNEAIGLIVKRYVAV